MDNSGGTGGRWGRLFADLEQQWDAQARRDLDEEVAGRTRRERATVRLVDRLGWAADPRSGSSPVRVRLLSGSVLTATVADVGRDWVLLVDGRTPALVPLAAVALVEGLPQRTGGPPPHRRFGLGDALRALARDRAVVAVTNGGGHTVTGTIDAVLADAFDLSEHHSDLARREDNVRARITVPFTALTCVRAAG